MRKKRILQLVLAAVIVFWGIGLLVKLPFFIQGFGKPDAQDIVAMLASPDPAQRARGLQAKDHLIPWSAPLREALANRVVHETQAALRAQAMQQLSNSVDSHSLRADASVPPLPVQRIEQIIALVQDDRLALDLREPLLSFAGRTARWQPHPQAALAKISALLEQHPQAREQRTLLATLKAYAVYHVLPESVLQGLLPVFQNNPSAYRLNQEVAELYSNSAARQSLPGDVRAAIEKALIENPDRQMRMLALRALEAQGRRLAQVPVVLYTALQDPDADLARNVSYSIARIKEAQGDALSQLVSTARDTDEPALVRIAALERASVLHREQLDAVEKRRLADAIQRLRRDDNALVRAHAVRLLGYLLPDPDAQGATQTMLAYIDEAMDDRDAQVRIQALSLLASYKRRLDEQDLLRRLLRGLQDQDTQVLIATSDLVRRAGVHSDPVVALLQQHAASDDPRLSQTAGHTLRVIHEKTRSPWQVFLDVAGDTERHGLRLFWLLCVLASVTALGFAVYYVYRMIVYISERRARAFAAAGVLLFWVALSVALVVAFVVAVFSFGHNALISPAQQFTLDAAMAVIVIIYAGIGWGMRLFIRR